ncbi:MAG TPA: hypothetical protein VGE39_00260, partial [Prosthecobacter sp.]
FNERNHNPPAPDADFDNEFDSAIDMIRPILLRHAPEDEFQVWYKHNRARFIDVAFESQAYLQPALVNDIQQWLLMLPEAWMVCLWESSFLFVTRDQALFFSPLPDDPEIQEFMKIMTQA